MTLDLLKKQADDAERAAIQARARYMEALVESEKMPDGKICRNCRYWDMHSLDMKKGDCRAPSDHRWWRYTFPSGERVLLDSFGREETKPDYHCGAWEAG